MPSSIKSIEAFAFSGCKSLASIEILASIEYVGQEVFESTNSSLIIYCEVNSVPDNWYSSWNPNNRTVVFGYNNIKTDSIYDYVIHDDKAYLTKFKGSETNIVVPSSIANKEIVAFGNIFKKNTSIISVKLPNGATKIIDNAFSGCSSLTSIEIPSSITSIGADAFSDCSSLTSIEIPSSITSIGSYAFSGCSSLESITVERQQGICKSKRDII